ncbi:transmembrane 4 L6 family member 1-like [Periophthalmus magnuspinnatus]|uniref:transmembrane 4 L6 family member 1-like n=1 Tax=Periophthalmus magnuspinnatus TaxID=409849 RepID=UPI0024368B88|nr:transmembrane 4 L6 family member 1-like [Periophthalmus magnuspinnatus]
MCVSRCLCCVGVVLVVLAIVCFLSNLFLLFPNMDTRFLLEGHVTREALWCTGLWGSGLTVALGGRSFLMSSRTTGCCVFRSKMLSMVLVSLVCLAAAAFSCLTSVTGLVQGPMCLYNATSGPTWGVPLGPTADRDPGYLWNRSIWSGVCVEPRAVVQWNLVWFGLQSGSSLVQTLLCAINVLNALTGVVLGRGLHPNKVAPSKV